MFVRLHYFRRTVHKKGNVASTSPSPRPSLTSLADALLSSGPRVWLDDVIVDQPRDGFGPTKQRPLRYPGSFIMKESW